LWLAYALPYADLTAIILYSGAPTAALLLWLHPGDFAYWLDPEGGPLGPALVVVFSAWLQFTLAFSLLAQVSLLGRSKDHPLG
jgi:hypothetical protein